MVKEWPNTIAPGAEVSFRAVGPMNPLTLNMVASAVCWNVCYKADNGGRLFITFGAGSPVNSLFVAVGTSGSADDMPDGWDVE